MSKRFGRIQHQLVINYKDIDFVVKFYISPVEKQTLDYPGCPAEIYDLEIYHGYDIFNELLSEKQIEEIIDIIWNDLINNN